MLIGSKSHKFKLIRMNPPKISLRLIVQTITHNETHKNSTILPLSHLHSDPTQRLKNKIERIEIKEKVTIKILKKIYA